MATLVVGLDGSPRSWSAFAWAWGEAERLRGRVLVVHVSSPTESVLAPGAFLPGADTTAYIEAVGCKHIERAAELEAEARRIAGEAGSRLEFRHVEGDAAEQLTRIAREYRADLIAVGRSAGWRHRLRGSVGGRLTRAKRSPIVVVVP